MPRYDDAFVDRFLEPWNRHDVDGALSLMTDDCVWEVTRGHEPHGTLHTGRAGASGSFTTFAAPLNLKPRRVMRLSGGWQSSHRAVRSHISAGCLTITAFGDGFSREAERLKDAWAQNDEAQAMRAVTDEMVLTLSATGTPDDVALRLDALLRAGLKQAVLFPLSTDGDAKAAILRTIELLS